MKRSILFAAMILLFAGCKKEDDSPAVSPKPQVPTTVLTFTYGSEKDPWVKSLTAKFNASQTKTAAGNVIRVDAIPMGSGDCMDEVLNDRRQTHITSPASAAFIELGNAQSRAKTGADLVSKTDNLLLSPVVIAMWRPMAEAMGYPAKSLGWSDIIEVSQNPQGWGSLNHAEWGAFKFGHTHPEYSNSGLISVMAEFYAGAGKRNGLTVADITKPETQAFVASIEKAVVHYGTSTGFFSKKMFEKGPDYLSAAVMYESDVLASQGKSVMPVVAIYPKEGTFWSDHPIGIVDRPYVTPEHRAAAKKYIDFLLSAESQTEAMTFGFRPSDPSIALSDSFSSQNGVDPKEPKTTLELPRADVTQSVIDTWKRNKKPANVILVFDTSGSMNEEGRISLARQSALDFVGLLHENDLLSFVPFSTKSAWRFKSLAIGENRGKIQQEINAVYAAGGTALYDTILEAVNYAKQNRKPGYITAVIVMTDGEDTDSVTTLDSLAQQVSVKRGNEVTDDNGIRVFTIGYGGTSRLDILNRISDPTNAKAYKGTNDSIRAIFKEIATFF